MNEPSIKELLESAEYLIKDGSPMFAVPDLHRALRQLAAKVESLEQDAVAAGRAYVTPPRQCLGCGGSGVLVNPERVCPSCYGTGSSDTTAPPDDGTLIRTAANKLTQGGAPPEAQQANCPGCGAEPGSYHERGCREIGYSPALDRPEAQQEQAAQPLRMPEPHYQVEVYHAGCDKCGDGKTWAIFEDGIAGGTSFSEEGEAIEQCDELNEAYFAGVASVAAELARLRDALRWRDAGKEKPTDTARVICLWKDDPMVILARWSEPEKRWMNQATAFSPDYWLLLPPRPQQETP